MDTDSIRSITRATALFLLFSLWLLPARGWPQALPPGFQEVPLEGSAVTPVAPPECDKKLSFLASPDNRRVACIGKNNGKPAVLLDGVLGPGYDEISPLISSPPWYSNFSSDSRHFAYSARRGRKWRIVLDGVEQAPFDLINNLSFSPDGNRLAYVGCEERNCSVWIDDKNWGPFDAVGELAFSRDSQHFVFTAARYLHIPSEYRIYVVTDQQTWEVSAGPLRATVSTVGKVLGEHLPAFIPSPDGKHVVWVEQGKLVRDGETGPACEELTQAGFSADGKRLAVVCGSKLKASLMVDNEVRREFDPKVECPSLPTLSPDGQRFAYVIQRLHEPKDAACRLASKAISMFRGQGLTAADWNALDTVPGMRIYRRGFRLVLDGKEMEESVAMYWASVKFSPDGRRLAYHVAGVRDTRKHLVVLDGREGKLYDFIGGFSFVDNNTISYIAVEGGKRFQVTHSVQ